jgi:Fic family protein
MRLIGPLVAKEAAVSSKIEGTQSDSSDIYVFDAGGKPAYSDTPVVSNYRTAMLDAIQSLKEGNKLTPHLIKSLHAALLKGVRHSGTLGDFRSKAVWIAEREGDPIEKALYVPPEHVHVATYIENLLDYVETNTDDINLVKTGVIHYQFEGVHPFEDGNGRIGRLLIPLVLFYKGELSLPIVYSSGYFEARPQEYRNALRSVDQTGSYESWLKFFFNAITEQAKDTMALIERIQALHHDVRAKYESSKSPYMSRFIDFLFDSPVFTIPMMQAKMSLSVRLTAVRLVEQLERDRLIDPVRGQRGPGGSNLYAFDKLLAIIK